MPRKNPLLFTLFILLPLMVSLSSCTKKRPQTFAQGQGGTDLLKITDYEKQIYKLKVLGEKFKGDSSRANSVNYKVQISKDKAKRKLIDDLNNFPLLNYQTNAPHFENDIPFRGRPEAISERYQIQTELTDKYLIYYKVSLKEDLPYQEALYSEEIKGTDLWKVPLFGYPINYYKVEQRLNGDHKKTQTLIEIPLPNKRGADRFKADFSRRKVFQAIAKQDVYPKEFFEREHGWFYKATVVKKKENELKFIMEGQELQLDKRFDSVSRIEFMPAKTLLNGMNLNVDQKHLKIGSNGKKDKSQFTPALQIPIEPVEFEVDADDPLRELEKGDKYSYSKPWDQRQYYKMELENTFSIANQGLFSKGDASELEDISITNDYFGFTVHYPGIGLTIRYSMKAATPQKQGRIAWKDDIENVFGFFASKSNENTENLDYRDKDFERHQYIYRFYPTNGDVTYRFSKEGIKNKAYRDAAKRALEAWNEAFASAQTGIQISHKMPDDYSEDVHIGDIRYNVIHLVDSRTGFLFGYGPSVADSKSGEIISATSNIYVTDIEYRVTTDIRNYIYYRIGLIKGNFFALPDSLRKVLKKKFYNNKENSPPLNGFEIANQRLINDIQNLCTEDLLPYVDELLAHNSSHPQSFQTHLGEFYNDNNKEKTAIRSCAEKLTAEKIYSVTLHELGHNFGLRHNFAGSADKDRMEKDAISSTVMEYMPPQSPHFKKPGPYDKAAIRFAYRGHGSIQLANNQWIEGTDYDPTKTISENLKGQKLLPYRFCTDGDLGTKNSVDALCLQRDLGKDPLEIVQNYIIGMNNFLEISRHRFDRVKPNLSTYRDLSQRFSYFFLEPMQRIYGQWRIHFSKSVGVGKQHLFSYNETEFAEKVSEYLNPNDNSPKNLERHSYYQAGELVAKAVYMVGTMSERYCTGLLTDNTFISKSLKQIRLDMSLEIENCDDPRAESYLEAASGGNEVITIYDSGIDMYDSIYSDSPERRKKKISVQELTGQWATTNIYDLIGYSMIRKAALTDLVTQIQWSKEHKTRNLKAVIMHEPWLRDMYAQFIFDRILKGVEIKSPDFEGSIFISKFRDEKKVLDMYFYKFARSLTPLGDDSINGLDLQKRPYWVSYTDKGVESLKTQRAVMWTPLKNKEQHYFFVRSGNYEALRLVKKREELRKMGTLLELAEFSDELSVDKIKSYILDKTKEQYPELSSLNLKTTELISLINSLGSVRSKNKTGKSSLENQIEVIFQDFLSQPAIVNAMWVNSIPLDFNNINSLVTAGADKSKISNLTPWKFLKANDIEVNDNTPVTFEDMVEKHAYKVLEFVNNKGEYDAQSEAILKSLEHLRFKDLRIEKYDSRVYDISDFKD